MGHWRRFIVDNATGWAIIITVGNINDSVPAIDLLSGLKNDYLIEGKDYDTEAILKCVTENQQVAVIPPRSTRIVQRPYDKHLYKNGTW